MSCNPPLSHKTSIVIYSGTTFILSPMGQKKLTVLTCDRIKEGLFTGKMYGRFARRPIEGAGNNEVTVGRGSTVVATHYLA